MSISNKNYAISLLEAMVLGSEVSLEKKDRRSLISKLVTPDGMKIALSILQVSKQAIEDFILGNLSSFDPLVSDQACQKNAIRIAVLAQQYMSDTTLKLLPKDLEKKIISLSESIQKSQQSENDIQKVLKEITNDALSTVTELQKSQTGELKAKQMGDAISNVSKRIIECKEKSNNALGKLNISEKEIENYDIQLPLDLIDVIRSAMLTKAKTQVEVQEICTCHSEAVRTYTEISNEKKVFSGISQDPPDGLNPKLIIEKNKQAAASRTNAFMSSQIGGSLFSKVQQTVNKREELPCLLTVGGALEIACQNKIPILIKVMKATHSLEVLPKDIVDTQAIFALEKREGELKSTVLEKVDQMEPLLVIEGQRFGKDETQKEYQERLISSDIVRVILENGAAHTQYSVEKYDQTLLKSEDRDVVDLTKKIGELKLTALKNGSCLENQTLFRIIHIYPSTIKGEKK